MDKEYFIQFRGNLKHLVFPVVNSFVDYWENLTDFWVKFNAFLEYSFFVSNFKAVE